MSDHKLENHCERRGHIMRCVRCGKTIEEVLEDDVQDDKILPLNVDNSSK